MTLHRLQLFVSIARHLNITYASRELHVSQPAVSYQLKLLQEEFGIALIKKQGRNICLTEEGRAFLNTAKSIISQLDGLKRKASARMANHPSELLAVAGSHAPSTALLPSLMAKFIKIYPLVSLTLHTASSREIQDLILAAKTSTAILTNPTVSPSLNMEPFQFERISAFVSKSHPLAQKANIDFAELARVPLIVKTGRQNQSRTEEALRTLGAWGFVPKTYIRCESPDAMKTMVRESGGIGLMYESMLAEEVQRGEFKLINLQGIDLTIITYLVYSKENYLSPIAQACLEFLRDFRDERLNKR